MIDNNKKLTYLYDENFYDRNNIKNTNIDKNLTFMRMKSDFVDKLDSIKKRIFKNATLDDNNSFNDKHENNGSKDGISSVSSSDSSMSSNKGMDMGGCVGGWVLEVHEGQRINISWNIDSLFQSFFNAHNEKEKEEDEYDDDEEDDDDDDLEINSNNHHMHKHDEENNVVINYEKPQRKRETSQKNWVNTCVLSVSLLEGGVEVVQEHICAHKTHKQFSFLSHSNHLTVLVRPLLTAHNQHDSNFPSSSSFSSSSSSSSSFFSSPYSDSFFQSHYLHSIPISAADANSVSSSSSSSSFSSSSFPVPPPHSQDKEIKKLHKKGPKNTKFVTNKKNKRKNTKNDAKLLFDRPFLIHYKGGYSIHEPKTLNHI